jgi:hypothetical protein
LKFDPLESVERLCHTDGMAKRPRDPAQLAKQVFDIAIGEEEDTVSAQKKRTPAKRVGGLAGGKARAKKLTSEQRREIAKVAASARWKKRD